ncbi:creatininase family protein [Nocardia vaccinii]|uniref:creatininase family protein n=1 Tax=Nocardia vaccinii TaxID=1822 RepID=UPI0009FEFE81|nr:creatininase family protein [Nocardia vaccinii]
MDLITTATSTDVARQGANTAVLPVGSFEQHGEHLPLITDTAIACLIAERLADTYDLFLLPPVTISCSHEHAGFAGTVSISAATLIALIDDVRLSLERSGIDKLVLVNGHGGNYATWTRQPECVVVRHGVTVPWTMAAIRTGLRADFGGRSIRRCPAAGTPALCWSSVRVWRR